MTKIAQIDDHGSALAWSPLKDYADVVALGTKVSYYHLSFSALAKNLQIVPFCFCEKHVALEVHGKILPCCEERRDTLPTIRTIASFLALGYVYSVVSCICCEVIILKR